MFITLEAAETLGWYGTIGITGITGINGIPVFTPPPDDVKTATLAPIWEEELEGFRHGPPRTCVSKNKPAWLQRLTLRINWLI